MAFGFEEEKRDFPGVQRFLRCCLLIPVLCCSLSVARAGWRPLNLSLHTLPHPAHPAHPASPCTPCLTLPHPAHPAHPHTLPCTQLDGAPSFPINHVPINPLTLGAEAWPHLSQLWAWSSSLASPSQSRRLHEDFAGSNKSWYEHARKC